MALRVMRVQLSGSIVQNGLALRCQLLGLRRRGTAREIELRTGGIKLIGAVVPRCLCVIGHDNAPVGATQTVPPPWVWGSRLELGRVPFGTEGS